MRHIVLRTCMCCITTSLKSVLLFGWGEIDIAQNLLLLRSTSTPLNPEPWNWQDAHHRLLACCWSPEGCYYQEPPWLTYSSSSIHTHLVSLWNHFWKSLWFQEELIIERENLNFQKKNQFQGQVWTGAKSKAAIPWSSWWWCLITESKETNIREYLLLCLNCEDGSELEP
jgi:hypothetical protein